MTFADAARLELDDLLEQLVARAWDVQDTQGRLRGLLRAYRAVARADDLDIVLRHIVEAARPMRSFLGVPIRVGDRVFGNLYLTEAGPG